MEDEIKETAGDEGKSLHFSLKKNLWLNILLFVITVFTTFFVGISLGINYKYPEIISQNNQAELHIDVFRDPQVLALSFTYVVVLLGILLGHELGHFLACRHYRINATLPYFIPAPTLIGTLGAFIKIKSPITRKTQLFDIGIAGPLTGFILSIPALVYGLSLSRALPLIPHEEASVFIFGEPLIYRIFASLFFKGVPSDFTVILHPVAFAGWVGILVTSFNLFPVGQLDGGHVSYALFGPKSKYLARVFLAGFLVMGIIFWMGWFLWAIILFFLGLKHPRIVDEATMLSSRRKILGYLLVLIFILSFTPDPIKGFSLFDKVRIFHF